MSPLAFCVACASVRSAAKAERKKEKKREIELTHTSGLLGM
jgi:hypothetical protein